MTPPVAAFVDDALNMVSDPATGTAANIDPVLDDGPPAGTRRERRDLFLATL